MTETELNEIEFMARRLKAERKTYSAAKDAWVKRGLGNTAEQDREMQRHATIVTEYGWSILDKLCEYVK